ncbi:MAG TPA: metallophosphoesterase [Anaeromyxobacteraceae bacterium]|nr:metallophosphoesterase [Anaeromyxobacteraceae bacterium]
MTRTLAHISDLHIGRDRSTDAHVERLARALEAAEVDDILLSGDVTHKGRSSELDHFERLFAPIRSRLRLVPGNHDRAGDDVAKRLMPGPRVQAELREDLFLVRVDSTAPHNKSLLDSHGELFAEDIAEAESLAARAPARALVVLMLHHHVLPLPFDHLGERIVSLLGWPCADELERGRDLLERLRGRCDLILHGHRHALAQRTLFGRGERSLRVLNAGSTPELGKARLLVHQGGRVLAETFLHIGERAVASGRTGRPLPAGAAPAAA